jgi:hypothetical protein
MSRRPSLVNNQWKLAGCNAFVEDHVLRLERVSSILLEFSLEHMAVYVKVLCFLNENRIRCNMQCILAIHDHQEVIRSGKLNKCIMIIYASKKKKYSNCYDSK